MSSPKLRWYGAKCVFQIPCDAEAAGHRVYEERVTLWRASSFEEAIAKAEVEAEEYAGAEGRYLGYCNVFELYDNPAKEGAEVFSLLRESELPEADYLDRFFDDGQERTQRISGPPTV